MTTYGIVTSKTPSLTVVGKDIARVIEKSGHRSVLFTKKIQWYDARKEFERGIVFIPFDPLYAPIYFLLARNYAKHGIPSVVYTTVEGRPKKWLIKDWFKRDCVFIANSHFTKTMLTQLGIEVRKTIYHGVDIDLINRLKPEVKKRKKELKKDLGAKVLFGTVASDHPRKGMPHLASTLKTISPDLKGVRFFVLTTPKNIEHFKDIPNVYVSPHFGNLDRNDILTLIGSFDFLLHPSFCEGFGLPLLEAQAFGVPCVFPKYAPLTEIVHPTANFPIKISSEDYRNLGDGVMYLCHLYDPEEMASAIAKAYEKYTCSQEEYDKMKKQVTEFAQGFNIMKLYREFLKT